MQLNHHSAENAALEPDVGCIFGFVDFKLLFLR